MLSRVAESLYWMSRYLERAENTARLLDVHLNVNLELAPAQGQKRYESVTGALQVSHFDGQPPTPAELTLDPAVPESISSCIGGARENARQIREQISSEMFEQLNKLFLYIRSRPTQDRFSVEPHSVLQKVKDGIHLFQGITDSTMSHGQGWEWIRAGRCVERAALVSGLVLSYLNSQHEETELYPELLGLLKSCTAWEAYCKVYGAELTHENVAEFLLLNRDFPHSLLFSLSQMAKALESLAQSTGMTAQAQLESKVGKLLARLRYATIEEVLEQPDFLAQVQADMGQVHDRLYGVYLHQTIARSQD